MSRVSIVLPTYNGEKYIRESIDSILNQSFTDWELIIVDDCSTDNTPEIVEQYAANDARIKVIHNQENQKLPQSLNIGFEHSKGEFLTWTSDDNYYLPTALERMYTYLVANEDVYLVCADMEMIDSVGKEVGKFKCYNIPRLFYRNGIGACFMYRRVVAEQIGGYDKELFLIEDYDYWLRLLKRYGSSSIRNIEEILYVYRVHENSLTVIKREQVKKKTAYLQRKNLDWILEKLKDEKIHLWRMYHDCIHINEDMHDIQKKVLAYAPEFGIDLSKEDKNKRVIIFGAGGYGKKAADYLKGRVAYFADSDEAKVGSYKNGIKIISTRELFQIYSAYNILIAVQSEEKMLEILHFLYENGVRECCTYQKVIGVD